MLCSNNNLLSVSTYAAWTGPMSSDGGMWLNSSGKTASRLRSKLACEISSSTLFDGVSVVITDDCNTCSSRTCQASAKLC